MQKTIQSVKGRQGLEEIFNNGSQFYLQADEIQRK
nr:MAG TPA: hypothetical protein [Caudoviricetes sp.]